MTSASAVAKILATRPRLRDLVSVREAMGLSDGELGHAGPPFGTTTPPPVVLNALAGAAIHEGWAGDMEQARRMIRSGDIVLRPNHTLATVSPMAGVVRPSQRVLRVEDAAGSASTFVTLAEKGRRVLRFGCYDGEVASALRQLETKTAEAIASAIPRSGIDILDLVASGLADGDDVHQHNVGGMSAFLRALPTLGDESRSWLADHPQHVLNYAMAAAKLCLDNARGIEGCAVVTAISRNGATCGIQLSGTGDLWFEAPAAAPLACFIPGYSSEDAHPDLGDSAIMEAFGLGGCVAHASPPVAAALDCPWPEAKAAGERMRSLFVDRHPTLSNAIAGTAGVGVGLDARAVLAGGEPVRIHTGVAHRDGRTGWIGIGVAGAPLACFTAAVRHLERREAGAMEPHA